MSCIVCTGPLPDLAVEHGDEFCTNVCARAYHGCSLPVVVNGRTTSHGCGGCGCALDERTARCDGCTRRHRRRAERTAVLGEAAIGRPDEARPLASSPSTDDEFHDLELLAALEEEAA